MVPIERVAFELADEAAIPISVFQPEAPYFSTHFVNGAFEQLTGYTRDMVIGNSWTHMLDGQIDSLAFDDHIQELRRRTFSRVCYWGQKANGNRFFCLMFNEIVKFSEGQNLAVACHFDLSSTSLAKLTLDPEAFDDTALLEDTTESQFGQTRAIQRHAFQMRAAGLVMAIRNRILMARV